MEDFPLPAVRPSSRWALDRAAWDALLLRLESPERYETLRGRLLRFFRWERFADSEDLADDVLNRVARKLADGEQIQNLDAYVSAVARLVLREAVTRDRRRERALERMPEPEPLDSAPEDPPAQECLERQLAKLPPPDRDLILRYYSGERSGRIEIRKQLATQLGLNRNALRNRALRLRARLETLVRACLESRDGSRSSPTTTRDGRKAPGDA